MGILDSLLGKSQAEASRRAAADTYAKQTAATDSLRTYGDTLPGRYADIAKGYDPYIAAGSSAIEPLTNLIADPSSVRTTPGYDFDFGEGVNAIDRSAASRGMLNSGRTLKDLTRFGQGHAEKYYGDAVSRLMQLMGMGQGATGAKVATEASGIGAQTGTRTSAYAGEMGAANTIGMGDVAAETAKSSALQNLLGGGLYLAGSWLGGRK